MQQHVSESRARAEELILDYNVVELLEIMKDIPKIEEFLTEMEYMKAVNIDVVYN